MGVGPSTKETSLHHFRDPLVDVLGNDTGIDLMGVLVFGSPGDNKDKIRVSTRAAVIAECSRADGVILESDGWGNFDVDYVNCVQELGESIKNLTVTLDKQVAEDYLLSYPLPNTTIILNELDISCMEVYRG